MHGLHDFADADRHAHVLELRPAGQRIGREGKRLPLRIVDVVVGLLGVGAGKVGASDGRFARDVDAEDGVPGIAADGVESGRADAGDLPLAAVGLVERRMDKAQAFRRWAPEGRGGDVHAHIDLGTGRDGSGCVFRAKRREGVGSGRSFRHHERGDLKPESFRQSRIELRELDIELVGDVRLVVGAEPAGFDPLDQLLGDFVTGG